MAPLPTPTPMSYLLLWIYSFLKDIFSKVSKKRHGCKWTRETFNIALGHKFKLKNSAFIAVLHFTVTVGSSTMTKTHTLA
jgi:hypothetical protein